MKITDSPGAMLVIPPRANAAVGDSEPSSTFHPVMSTALAPMLVTSNQSAATGLLPLLHSATSVTRRTPGAEYPGDPISTGEFAATNAPFTPATLKRDTVALFSAAVLSKV